MKISSEFICQSKLVYALPQVTKSFTDMPRFGDIPQVITLADSDDVDNQSSICSVSCHDADSRKRSSRYDHHMRPMGLLPQGKPLTCPPRIAFQQVMSQDTLKNNKRKLFPPGPSPLKYVSQALNDEDPLSVSSKKRVSDCSNHSWSSMVESKASSTTRDTVSASSLAALHLTKNTHISTSKEFRNINLLTLVASHACDYPLSL